MTAGELAGRLNLKLKGDAARILTRAAALDEAAAGELAYVANHKYFAQAAHSGAEALIAPAEYDGGHQTVLVSPQPRAHFARAFIDANTRRSTAPGAGATIAAFSARRGNGANRPHGFDRTRLPHR